MTAVLFHTEAEEEARQATVWYADISRRLGKDFAEEVDKAIERIVENPEAWARFPGTRARKCPVFRFPYSIVYLVVEGCILILAVAHAHRRPGYWSGRAH